MKVFLNKHEKTLSRIATFCIFLALSFYKKHKFIIAVSLLTVIALLIIKYIYFYR